MNEAALGSLKLHFGSMGSRPTETSRVFLPDPDRISQLKCSHAERVRERETHTHTHTHTHIGAESSTLWTDVL
jgi:hypothetical protein